MGVRGLFLPQPGIPDFVDSPSEVLPPLRSGWGKWEGEEGGTRAGM